MQILVSNPELAKMISKWLIYKTSSTFTTSIIAIICIILFWICLVIPATKHWYKKIIISIIIVLIGTSGLCTSNQVRYHDSQVVGAYQRIQLNRKLGSKIPHDKKVMERDNYKYIHYSRNRKRLSLKQKLYMHNEQKQYTHMYKIIKIRQAFNKRNNHVKQPKWYDAL